MKSKLFWIGVAAPLTILALPEPVYANDSIRCGRHIISSGQRHGPYQYEVLKKCGEPTARTGNSWTYEHPRHATRVIVFDHSGRILRIERLPK